MVKGRKSFMKTLIVIDMQNDFIDGSLGSKEAVAIIDKVRDKIEKYKANGERIIFTRDTHMPNYLETNEGKNLPVEHCIKDTFGWEIRKELQVEDALVIDKPTFGYVNWGEMNFDEIEIIGLCTDICVVSNAIILKSNFPEIKITVDSSCCAGVTPESHQSALDTMRMCQIEVN